MITEPHIVHKPFTKYVKSGQRDQDVSSCTQVNLGNKQEAWLERQEKKYYKAVLEVGETHTALGRTE